MTSGNGHENGHGSGREDGAACWAAAEAAVPEFAAAVRERFGAYRHHVLATLRKDGAPRLGGLEADFRYGELWLGLMIGSRKALDLRRDPRFALHANPGGGTDLAEGDVRVAGRAVEVTDPGPKARYAAAAKPPEPFHLYRALLTEVVRTSAEKPFIKLEIWRPGRPLRTIRRTSDDPGVLEQWG
ncbi:pyridoxamine 5'-phosphate oxidase family protein [Streptomyces sp. NPDC020883]|uniref:pyridoxamine 5'-phosphate oxidase family protein n=1 Tax=unclassified Streptomyces TaxID=2593676 RepID=UPI0021B1585B|nr:pyridoxamine 5'-phosphate oxidase family protein [Streptomyces sp. BHT-5-2]